MQGIGFGVFPVVAIILVVWFFNRWRVRTPKTLRDLVEKKRSALPDGDTNTVYLRFLENYRDALASPKRYFFSGLLMIVFGIIFAYVIVKALSSGLPNMLVTILVVDYLLFVFLYWGGFYCIGILTWVMYVSGSYVRKLVRAFQLSIQPFHPDQCGGLMMLGNFCFGLVLPLLIGSGLLIGYSIFALVRSKIFSTVLGVSGSLLIGVITAALQQYFLPAILMLLFHTP